MWGSLVKRNLKSFLYEQIYQIIPKPTYDITNMHNMVFYFLHIKNKQKNHAFIFHQHACIFFQKKVILAFVHH